MIRDYKLLRELQNTDFPFEFISEEGVVSYRGAESLLPRFFKTTVGRKYKNPSREDLLQEVWKKIKDNNMDIEEVLVRFLISIPKI